jgi:alkylation response protein AidB-like acyl-CoA dehydrogenase
MCPARRDIRDETTQALLDLTRQLADAELRPAAAAAEREARFPREKFRLLGEAGLLGLPYPEQFGGGGVSYEAYLQVVEELAGAWMAVGMGVSVHTLTCFPLVHAGTAQQQERWLPDMLGGDLLGAYCLSEPGSGSDAAALQTRASADGGDVVLNGVKAWISHAGQADFYTLFARTSGDHEGPDRARGISCFHVPAQTPGVSAGPAEHKMGISASVTAQMSFDGARVPADHLWGSRGAASGSRSPRWTPAGWASPPARRAWPRLPWTRRCSTPGSAASSAGR